MTEDGERIAKNSGIFDSGYYLSTQDSSDFGAGTIFVIVLYDYWS